MRPKMMNRICRWVRIGAVLVVVTGRFRGDKENAAAERSPTAAEKIA
jgi:hypothetical protein